MRVASAVTFQNTGSEVRWRLAAAAAAVAAPAKPLVRAGNLTIDPSVICKGSGSGVADSEWDFFRNAEVAPLFVPELSRTLFSLLDLVKAHRCHC